MFAQNASDLLRFFRAETADAVAPYLWEDWEVFGYMTEGFDALLKDTSVKYTVLTLPFTANNPLISLPNSVLHIRAAHIVGGDEVLPASATTRVALRTDDYGVQGTSLDTSMFTDTGTPEFYIRDYNRGALRLTPIPTADGQLEVQCSSTISVPMMDGAALPSTDAVDLRLVLHYMKSLAYRKQDAETNDLVRARDHEQQYNAGALAREQRLLNYRRPPGVVRMEW
jgi:hypothetical protein